MDVRDKNGRFVKGHEIIKGSEKGWFKEGIIGNRKGSRKSEKEKKEHGMKIKKAWENGSYGKDRNKKVSDSLKIQNELGLREDVYKKINKTRLEKDNYKHSDNTKLTMSLNRTGKPSSKRGLKASEKTIKKHSETNKRLHKEGKLKIWFYGLSKEEKLKHYKNGYGNTGKKYPKELYPNYGIRKIRDSLKLPVKDSSIELKIQDFLKQLNIEFYTHKYISEISHGYQCDILIEPQINFMTEKKTIIECDGDYFHFNLSKYKIPNDKQKGQMERDAIRNEELRSAGFNIIRLWENEIRKMNLESFKGILGGIIRSQ